MLRGSTVLIPRAPTMQCQRRGVCCVFMDLRNCCSCVGPLESTTSKKNCKMVCALACRPALSSRSKPWGHFAAHLRGALHPICAAYWSSSCEMSAARLCISSVLSTWRRVWRFQSLYPTRLRTIANKAMFLEAALLARLKYEGFIFENPAARLNESQPNAP